MAEFERKIEESNMELKILDLKTKDKDNELRLMVMRHREIEKQIEEYKKL